jgi:predicted TPR repeat methyltransferase
MVQSGPGFPEFPATIGNETSIAARPSLEISDDGILAQAIACSKAEHFFDAERLFEILLDRQPNHVRGHDQFGVLLAQIGRYEAAEGHIRQAIRLGSSSGATFYNHGTILKHLQRLPEALNAFSKALAINPADPETWNNRGTVLNGLARYGEAISDFDKAISLRADFAGAYFNRAKSLFLSGRQDEALAAYDRVLAMRPELPEVWFGRANACYQLKRYDDALAAYDKALTLKPDLTDAWLGRGNTLCFLKRYDAALAAHDKALALKPDFAEAWLGRSSIFGNLGRHEDSLAGFDKALTIRPDLAEAWLGRANACHLLKRYGDALAAYEKALTLKPDSAEAWFNCGAVFALLRRHEDAVASFDKTLAIKPDLAEAWLARGEALHALNRPDEAIVAFREALAKGGNAEAIRYLLASLGADAAPAITPKRLITELFDQYADRFDEHLIGTLKYRAPDLLFDAMTRFVDSRKLDILDLGCGTGLLGARFHPLARTLIGLDLSPNMLRVSQQRQIYDSLVCGELTEFLRTQTKAFDLAISTDVFIYIGDLSGIFQGVRGALRDGGLFGFSVEISEEQDFILRPNRRYAHSGAYLRKLAEDHRFALETIEPHVIRQDDRNDVHGYIAILSCS